jgi:hypothetical protein
MNLLFHQGDKDLVRQKDSVAYITPHVTVNCYLCRLSDTKSFINVIYIICHYAILCYHKAELSSINMFHECELCNMP